MVRRRTSSPRASGPVRSSAPSRAPAPMPQQQRAQVPPPGATPSQGPGLMGQMAATAGGVAIGSAVGHTVGHMLTGGGNSHEQQLAPQQTSQQQYQQSQQPCEIEWKRFLECSQSANDLSLCQAYNDLFKDCKTRNNL